MTAKDIDSSQNGNIVKYKIVSDNLEILQKFKLKNFTEISIASNQLLLFFEVIEELDHETTDTYRVKLIAEDNGVPSRYYIQN